MADFFWAGENKTGVTVIDMPEADNLGGVVPFYSMDEELAWMGPDAEFIKQIYAKDMTLADTNWTSWTPSSTASTMVASETIGTTYPSSEMTVYSYLIEWQYDFQIAYDGTQDSKARIDRVAGTQWQDLHRRPYGYQNIEDMVDSYNYCTTLLSGSYYVYYYNSSGTQTWTTGISYGVYPALVAATFSNTTSTNPTITFKTPTISARTSTSYFKVANAQKVTASSSTLRIRGNLYRRPARFSNLRNLYRSGAYIYSHPIPALTPSP